MSKNPENILKYVKENAQKGDVDDVIRTIDYFCWNITRFFNVGDVKGEILDNIFRESNPTTVLELGTFVGYSAMRMARLLKPEGKLYTIEINPNHSSLAKQMIEYAGLRDKVAVITGTSDDIIPTLKSDYGIGKLDFVFLDHFKEMYKKDFTSLMESGLFRKGTVIVADNVVIPGAPDYLEVVRNHPKLQSEYFESKLEYKTDVIDGLEKTTYLG